MGRGPPEPSESQFIRQSVDYCLRFVEEARILEYGPEAVKAVPEQIHKAKCRVITPGVTTQEITLGNYPSDNYPRDNYPSGNYTRGNYPSCIIPRVIRPGVIKGTYPWGNYPWGS